MPKLHQFNADYIAKTIVYELEKRGIPMKKIVNARSDGAAILTGKNAGVWTKLNPYFSLFSIEHDGAHRVNLVANDTGKSLVI